MRAIQLQTPGAPSNLKLLQLPIPIPKHGQVLIRVKAFGLNRSELLTRKFGRTPVGPVQLPRVLGVEAAGIVESAPGNEQDFPKGSVVMTAVGGMGNAFDGSYAEYTCVDSENVQRVREGAEEHLGWCVLGALPLMLQTAHGCLVRCLKIKRGETLLIRGGTTSIGLAAAAIAKTLGATVLATTRKPDQDTSGLLQRNGADHVIIDEDDSISLKVSLIKPLGVDKVLELVGGTTLADSLSCLAENGTCCVLGLVGGSPAVQEFNPLAMLRTGQYLTAYGERTFRPQNFPLDELVGQLMDHSLKIHIGRSFRMEEIHEAHELLESNLVPGKVVVLVD